MEFLRMLMQKCLIMNIISLNILKILRHLSFLLIVVLFIICMELTVKPLIQNTERKNALGELRD
jgi:hypothetical protein